MASSERRVGAVVWRWAPPLCLMVAVFVASSRPGHTLPTSAFQFSDKVIHAAVFFVLGALMMRALWPRHRGTATQSRPRFFERWLLLALIVCVAFGASDEIHQSSVPGRFADVFDWLADTLGSFLGVACYRLWRFHTEHEDSDVNRPQLS